MRVYQCCHAVLFVSVLIGGMFLRADGAKNPAMEVLPVEDAETLIKEKSLKHNAAVASSASGGSLVVSQGFPSSPGGSSGALSQQMGDKTEQPNGTALYGFLLQPGERIQITKSGESSSKVAMRIVEPLTPNAMTSLVQRANRAPRSVRCRRVTLENLLSEPFHMILLLYGEVGYSYELQIAREKKTR